MSRGPLVATVVLLALLALLAPAAPSAGAALDAGEAVRATAPGAAAAGAEDDVLEVTVRIEGPAGTIWSGPVTLEGTYLLTETSSGRSYELEARTPLGALHAASQTGGFSLRVDDAFAAADFTVEAVDGVREQGIYWWDYRVDLKATYYGAQHQWLDHGPGLQDGDEVLWYLETTGSRPLRLTVDAQAGAPGTGSGAASLRVEWPLVDAHHRAGTPWPPTQLWLPAHATRIVGDAEAPAPAGVAVVVLDEGSHTVKALADPDAYPVPTVRSATVSVVVP